MDKVQDNELETLMQKLGDFSRYQIFQFVLQVITAIPTGVTLLCLVVIIAVPDHRCALDEEDIANHTELRNFTSLSERIPVDEYGKLDSCQIYGPNGTVKECNSWIYDDQYYTSSIGIEWDLVCSRRWMGAISQFMFMSGVVVGSLVLGPLCDTFGRRTVYLWAVSLQFCTGILVAFTKEFYSFIAIRFLYGIFGISPFKASYVLMIELVGPSKRSFCGALFQILNGVGVMLVGVWGYFIDNKFYLQIIFACHALLLIPNWFLIDESPRWLWGKGRVREAITIVEKGIKFNKSSEKVAAPLITTDCKAIYDPNIKTRSTGMIDLFRTRNMARRTMIICGCWLAISLVYYGLTFNTGKLNGNPFFILTLSGFVELPGYIIGMYFVSKIGHRSVLSTTMITSGIACLAIVILPQQSTFTTVAAMIGKCIGSASYAVMYKFSAELFPTVVRSSGVGFGTMCASISAALTPLITLLDTFQPEIPTIIFGLSALVFGFFCMLLPETRGMRLPQTLEDGDTFGEGDTCFRNCRGRRPSQSSDSPEIIEPLKATEKNFFS